MTLSEAIKQAIQKSGKSVYQIAKESGVSQPVISRFLSDDPKTHRDIRLEATADRLAEYLGIKVQQPAAKKTKGK